MHLDRLLSLRKKEDNQNPNSFVMLSSTTIKGALDVFHNPAQPFKIVHAAPEVDGEPQLKKPCVSLPPESSTEKALFGCKADEANKAHSARTYYCRFCDKRGDHSSKRCPDNDTDSNEDPSIVEYSGEKEGYEWNCLLGCGADGEPCILDHGDGKTKGLYVPKYCDTCSNWGHWTTDCSIPPTFQEEELQGAAADAR